MKVNEAVQGGRALVVPRPQIEMLTLAQFGDPRGVLVLEFLTLPARHFEEVNRRNAVAAVVVVDCAFEVFDRFALSILTLEIRRREACEQQARFAESLKDALTLVGRAVDFLLVEEDAQLESLHSFKRGEILLYALNELSDAALRVVAARIGNEKDVGHGLIERLRDRISQVRICNWF